jgi:hypothetical protein
MKWFCTETIKCGYVEGIPIFLIPVYIVMLYTLYKVYIDAKSRGKNGFAAMLFILACGWPFSFIWWYWLRPEKKIIENKS